MGRLLSNAVTTYQVKVSLKTAELLRAKVFRQDSYRELGHVENTESISGIRPSNNHVPIRILFKQPCLAFQHREKPTRELLRNPSLSRSRESVFR